MNKKSTIATAKKQVATFESYKKVFLNLDGEVVLHERRKRAGVLDPIFTTDINQMLVREGARQLVLKILKDLRINVEHLRERMDEYVRDSE